MMENHTETVMNVKINDAKILYQLKNTKYVLFYFLGEELQYEGGYDQGSQRKLLSLSNDVRTGENVRTYNGRVPQTTCPIG